METVENPYVPVLQRNLPRLLALYQLDETHHLAGCGDRRYWAWKLIDFPNATFQGAALGLARMVVSGHLPDGLARRRIEQRIEAMIGVLPKLMDRRGGLAEALPNEGSFCVTGLVLGDAIGALDVLGNRLEPATREQLIGGMEPMARFLQRQDEYHGVISNHLASSALGMVRWGRAVSDPAAVERAALWIERIKAHASPEGWLREYAGADPGYQSWCTSALAQIAHEAPEFELDPLLERSFGFLEAFANPDGSYSNGCGARMTRFLFPGGAELCAARIPAAARLAGFARAFSGRYTHVGLDAIDEPNLAPLFNDIALAAVSFAPETAAPPPAPASHDFPSAGLVIRAQSGRVTTINVERGGWMAVSSDTTGTRVLAEPVAVTRHGKVLRSVGGTLVSESADEIHVEADLVLAERMLPSAAKFLILRLLSLTLFRSLRGGNFVKVGLARLLLGTRGKSGGRVARRINLADGTATDCVLSGDATLLAHTSHFSPMHMASQGYWQVSDDSAP